MCSVIGIIEGRRDTWKFCFLWALETEVAFLWALQTGSFVFLWALQTGSFVFLWALHSQDLLCFKSGLSTDRKFSSTAESTVRIFYVFLWALHSQDV